MTTVHHTPPVRLSELERYLAGDLVSRYLVGPAAEVATLTAGSAERRVSDEQLIEASDRLRVLSLVAAIAAAPDGAPVPVDDVDAIVALMEHSLREAHEAATQHIKECEEATTTLAQLRSEDGDRDEIDRLCDELRDDRAQALEDMAHAGACRAVLDALKEVSR